MSTEPKYTDAQLEKVAIRLDELVIAVADWRIEEFDMRIPAEPDRDADLVIQRAAYMLRQLLSERQAAMQGQGGEAIIGLLRVLCPEGEKFHSDNPSNPSILDIRKLADTLEALQPPQPCRRRIEMGEKMTLEEVVQFLLGEEEMSEVYFGERPDGEGRYFWRKHLRDAWSAHLATPAQTVDVDAVREVIKGMRCVARLTDDLMTRDTFTVQADKLSQAIGDKT